MEGEFWALESPNQNCHGSHSLVCEGGVGRRLKPQCKCIKMKLYVSVGSGMGKIACISPEVCPVCLELGLCLLTESTSPVFISSHLLTLPALRQTQNTMVLKLTLRKFFRNELECFCPLNLPIFFLKYFLDVLDVSFIFKIFIYLLTERES